MPARRKTIHLRWNERRHGERATQDAWVSKAVCGVAAPLSKDGKRIPRLNRNTRATLKGVTCKKCLFRYQAATEDEVYRFTREIDRLRQERKVARRRLAAAANAISKQDSPPPKQDRRAEVEPQSQEEK